MTILQGSVFLKNEHNSSPQSVFLEKSDVLLNRLIIKKGANTSYRILEVEYYLYSKLHQDLFSHRSDLQKTSAQWYFHRAPTKKKLNPKLRSGTRKGLDITFGNAAQDGGILLRSIQCITSGKVIEGPSLVVHELLDLGKIHTGSEYEKKTARLKKSIFDPHQYLRLERAELKVEKIFVGPRVNLFVSSRKKTETSLIWMVQPYRHLILPKFIRKHRTAYLAMLFASGHTQKNIHQLTEIPMSQIEKANRHFRSGKKTSLAQYTSQLDSFTPTTFAEIIGACQREDFNLNL